MYLNVLKKTFTMQQNLIYVLIIKLFLLKVLFNNDNIKKN